MSSNSSGQALSMVVNVLNPELVVLGGGLAQAGDILLSPEPAACSTRPARTSSSTRVDTVAGDSSVCRARSARGSDLLILTKP
jgi:predicted NBD/HSP70 family sugar kinase